MNGDELLKQLKTRGNFREIDIHFANFMMRLAENHSFELALASALTSNRIQSGHICLDLKAIAGKNLENNNGGDCSIVYPDLPDWENKLKSLLVVGAPGDYKPLIMDNKSRLYLYRYWDYEKKLGEIIKAKAEIAPTNIDQNLLRDGLRRLFADDNPNEIDMQKLAAYTALTKCFCTISGGPGTGKTFTVAKILALLLEQNESTKIALVAPTGKASARLQDSIRDARPKLNCSDKIRQLLPTEASTIHALLGSTYNSPYFKYNAQNQLPDDLVVVDEASMVDLALMSKLAHALRPEARLLLLGDKDQLSSVQAGAILGDVCSPGQAYRYSNELCNSYREMTDEIIVPVEVTDKYAPIRDCIVQLEKSYRFTGQSGIGIISRTINKGEAAQAAAILKSGRYDDIKWQSLPRPNTMENSLRDIVIENYRDYLMAGSPDESLKLFGEFKILSATREGPYGVKALNYYVENILQAARLIDMRGRWYNKKPIMITRNDYKIGLFNGDIGLISAEPGNNNELSAVFQAADGGLRRIAPIRLPEHETVYAISVHKSQGSEFATVLMILPDVPSPVVTRELLYTGITRAKKRISIWCPDKIFEYGVTRLTQRTSGLADIVWEMRP